MLATGAAGPHGVDLQIAFGDHHVHFLGFGQHRDGGGRGVDAAGGFSRRNPLYPVHAGFVLELGERAAAADLGDDLLISTHRAFAC